MSDVISGRDIIEEILEHMEKNSHPLLYSTLVPCVYQVCLRQEDYDALEVVFPYIKEQAKKALNERLEHLNGGKLRRALRGKSQMRYENAQGDWYIDFQPDADGEIASAGDFIVSSQLLEPSKPGYGEGSKTINLKTIRTADGSKPVVKKQERVYAKISYTDDGGEQIYLMTKKEIVIGRGGPAHWVDVKLDTVDDVSRNHVRIRYDEEGDRFFIKDISKIGTSVNGNKIPSSREEKGGVLEETEAEYPLPHAATIDLAGKQVLEFKAGGGR